MAGRSCRGCTGGKADEGKYLCVACWFRIPEASRRRLYRKDGYAFTRVRQLYDALDRGVPHEDIRITL